MGLRDSVGVAAEPTYGGTGGAATPPTRHQTLLDEQLKLDKSRIKSGGRTDTQLMQQSTLVRETTRVANGTLAVEPVTKGMGVFYNLLHGNTVTPTGAGAAKTQVHEIGKTAPGSNKSLCIEVGIEDVEGVRRAKQITGCVIEEANWKMSTGGILEQTFTIAGQDVKLPGTAPTATSYPAGFELFGFAEATVKLGGALVGDALVKEVSFGLKLPRKKDRHGLNGSALAKYPVVAGGKIEGSGEMLVEYSGTTQTDAFINATLRAFQLQCLGVTDIVAGTKASFTIDAPIIRVTDAIPVSSDEDVVMLRLPFEVEIGPTAPGATITYVSSDTAL